MGRISRKAPPRDGSQSGRIQSINPSTEEVIGDFPDMTDDDVSRLVKSAVDGAQDWAQVGWSQRASRLRVMAERIRTAEDELAQLDALDSGNPIQAMRSDIQSAVESIEYFAGLASETKGEVLPVKPAHLVYTQREPYGVVGRIIPFNHPAQFAASKVAAPLAAGNAVILKSAEQTSMSAIRLSELLADVFPPGVLQFATGRGSSVGTALVRHPEVPRIAFTGSVSTGQTIMREAAEWMKPLSLELGGKNPMIIFPDIDPTVAATATVDGMNFRRSQGQSCGSNSRVFVHENSYDAFIAELTSALESIVVGDASDEATEMGPVASKGQYEKVLRYIELGKQAGAQIVTGGGRPPGFERGYFVAPTVFINVDMNMEIAREEIFGPVVCVFKWSNLDEVVRDANDVPFGLTANIWTNDLALAHGVASRLNAGYVWINGRGRRPRGAPFGGFGLSGLGKENSLEEILSYTRQKTIDVSL